MGIALNLLLNTALLLAIFIFFNCRYQKLQTQGPYIKVLGGIFWGLTGILLTAVSGALPGSTVFDAGSILISVSGLFYGLLPTSVAALIMILYRLSLGGAAATGITIVLCSAAIGLLWRKLRKEPEKLSVLELYCFGLAAQAILLPSVFFLPANTAAETLKSAGVPALVIQPLGSLALCAVILFEQKKQRTANVVNASDTRFQSLQELCEQASVGIIVGNAATISYVNPAFLEMLGVSEQQISGNFWREHTHPDDIGKGGALFGSMIAGDIDQYNLIKRYQKPDGAIVCAHLYVTALSRAIAADQTEYICIARQITEEAMREQALPEGDSVQREAAGFWETMLDSSSDHIFFKDVNYVYLGCNKAFEEASGIPRGQLLGKNDFEIYGEDTAKLFVAKDSIVLKERREVRSEETVIYPDGHSIITETLKTPFFHESGELAGLIGISRDITDRKKKEEEIQFLSSHDMMTGLYSRMYFDTELYRIDTASELPYSIITGDINALKLTNDLFGHQEGDNLIIETASLLKLCCTNGIAARTGGDEFSVLLPRTGESEVAKIVSHINRLVEERKNQSKEMNCFLSISLGYATKSDAAQPISEVLKAAEEHMYRRKLLEHQSIRSTLLSTIKELLFSKSNETMEHAERMAVLAERMGHEVELSDVDLMSLELMATLHDVGKIGISDQILSKNGKLDEAEWVEIRKHPEIGYRIALTIPELQGIAVYILCHHERWDGKGYPQGLSGEEIPFISRLISVIDAFDAMTEDRSYRKAMTIDAAAEEIIRYAGTQFDPQIARIFVEKVLNLPFDS